MAAGGTAGAAGCIMNPLGKSCLAIARGINGGPSPGKQGRNCRTARPSCRPSTWPVRIASPCMFSPPSFIFLEIDFNVHLDSGRLSSGPPRAQAAERSLLAGRDSASPPDPELARRCCLFFEHRGPVCTGNLPEAWEILPAAPLYCPGFPSGFPPLSSMASCSSSLASAIILSQFRAAPAARISRRIRDNSNSHTSLTPLPGFSCSENSTPIKHRGRAVNPPLLRHASAAAPSTLASVVRRPGSQHPGPWY